MKKLCLITASIVLLSSHTAISAVTDNYAEISNKAEQILISENNAPIYQDYIIFSQKAVTNIVSSDNTIAHAYVMTTIDNTRDTIIIEAKGVGKAKLTATVDNKNLVINVTIKKNKTIIETDSDIFDCVSLDIPSEITDSEGA